MAPVPHPIRRVRKMLRSALPQAKYVRQSSPRDAIVVGFEPGISGKEKALVKAAFGQSKASVDGTTVRLDPAEFRKVHKQITLGDVVEKFEPTHGIGVLLFAHHAKGEDATTKAIIQVKIGVQDHLRAHLAQIETFAKNIPGEGSWVEVTMTAPEVVELTLQRRFDRQKDGWWLDQFAQKLSDAACVIFDTVRFAD